MDEKIKAIWAKNKIVVIISTVLVLALIVYNVISSNAQKALEQSEAASSQEEIDRRISEATMGTLDTSKEGLDTMLLNSQDTLSKKFGTAPEGSIWSLDGNLISLGDRSMSAEESLFAYLRGVSTLDFSTVQKFSRDSTVLATYETYFADPTKSSNYKDEFLRNMYKQALLSIQPGQIENAATFQGNKMVYTVKLRMLDLADKEFWKKDKDDIFQTLYLYEKTESDKTKAEQFLYDYILSHYSSESAGLKDVSVDFTTSRFADIDSGWLVSNDASLDAIAKYSDGTLVLTYIDQLYQQWKIDKLSAQ